MAVTAVQAFGTAQADGFSGMADMEKLLMIIADQLAKMNATAAWADAQTNGFGTIADIEKLLMIIADRQANGGGGGGGIGAVMGGAAAPVAAPADTTKYAIYVQDPGVGGTPKATWFWSVTAQAWQQYSA